MATNWNTETKSKLSEKVVSNIHDIGSLSRHIIKGSKSGELLDKSTRNFVAQEGSIENSSVTMKKMGLLVAHLQFQAESIERSVSMMDDIQDQLKTILR